MPELTWIKMDLDMFNNRKIKQISKLPSGDSIIVIWFRLLCIAGNVNDNGIVYFTRDLPYTEEMLAVEFDKDIKLIRLALDTFKAFHMIEIVNNFILVSNWEKYQNQTALEGIREYNREKKREQRQRQKNLLLLESNKRQGNVIDSQDTDNISSSNSIDIISLEENDNKDDEEKEVKHKFGSYKNVKLTNDEVDRLKKDYPKLDVIKLIEWFSAYIKEKGYKSKSHNLAIRRWVIDAYTKPPVKSNGKRFETITNYDQPKSEEMSEEEELKLKESLKNLGKQ